MPRLIDYGVRFELIREAVLAVTLREGAAAVCVPTVAGELGVSPATLRRIIAGAEQLPLLGVQRIRRIRAQRPLIWPGLRVRGASELQRTTRALEMHLPLDQDGLDECRAWAALTSASRQEEVLQHKLAYADELERLVEECVTRLGVPAATREAESLRLRVVVGGLIAAVCDDRMTFAQAKGVLDLHLADLAASGLEHVA